jgi:hypothetical protein
VVVFGNEAGRFDPSTTILLHHHRAAAPPPEASAARRGRRWASLIGLADAEGSTAASGDASPARPSSTGGVSRGRSACHIRTPPGRGGTARGRRVGAPVLRGRGACGWRF